MRAQLGSSQLPLYCDSSMRPCLGQGASLGEEAVLADSGHAAEKSGLFEHPSERFSPIPDRQAIKVRLIPLIVFLRPAEPVSGSIRP